MKKTYMIIAALLMAVLALQGCVKEYMNPVPEEGQPKPEQPAVEDDDIVKLLQSIQGVSDVVKTEAKKADSTTIADYFFYYEQLVDHFDQSKGTFKQRVGMQITDLKAPVVVHTQGYAMNMKGKRAENGDLMNFLKANWVEIEYRYFGSSLPEPEDNVEMTYLYSVYAAIDIHNVVTMLKDHVFKDSKWIATGTSKSGTTAGLQAYFSDKYDWKDFDLYVPFCGPFLAGSPKSPTDRSIGRYLLNNCGAGYAEDTDEAKAYVKLKKIREQAVTKPRLRNEILRRYHMTTPVYYERVLSVYGPREDAALCGALQLFQENLMGNFSYIPFGSWAPMVPDPDPIKEGEEDGTWEDNELIQKVVDFFFMNDEDIQKALDKAAEGAGTRASFTAEDMISLRAIDDGMPYGPQTVRELGCAGMDYSWVPGPFITPALADEVQEKASGRAHSWDYYEGQWDGGKLMSDFRAWVFGESTQKIIFVYGSNDPWTGGAIDGDAALANHNIKFFVNPGGIHNDYFLNQNYYAKETSEQIQAAITAFLGQ